jgi:hypothetical protein
MSGELPGVREAMRRSQKQLQDNGASPEYARRKSREMAQRHDRLRREGRLQNPAHTKKKR